ncbi:hybrid sensor histidine kinase/response regulator transcription factor [Pseudocnuella soli]|uniref:hybrid sensor histidine kinase/response regulator transcription factor n=1 Tax=Pseudocnuella soli TaxID=2502779 RepID=UPI00104F94BA|nr:ATP-binding protein [Pseudocnuella soli]
MLYRTNCIPLLLILAFAAFAAKAQQPQATNQQHFGVAEGLPQSFVSGITQDRDGFIWCSTLDGMSRYDGRSFKNFRHKNGDTTSLSANSIFYLLPHTNNAVSLMYDGSMVDAFDFTTAKARRDTTLDRLRKVPTALWKVHNLDNLYNGIDWVFVQAAHKGIGWVNRATEKVRFANRANGLLQQDTVAAYLQTPEGRVYLVSENGVEVSDPQKNRFTYYAFPTTIKNLAASPDQSLWLTTRSVALLPGNKLAVLDGSRIVTLHLAQKKASIISIPTATKLQLAEPEAAVKTDSKGQLYFKHNGRIFRMTAEGKLDLLWENTVAPQLNITAFFIDRSDVLWVSVNAQGLFKINLDKLPFQSFAYEKSFVTDVLVHAGISRSGLPEAWNDPYAAYFFRNAQGGDGAQYVTCNYLKHPKVYRLEGGRLVALPQGPQAPIYSALVAGPNGGVRAFHQQQNDWTVWATNNAVPTLLAANANIFKDVELADGRYIGGYYWLSSYAHGLFQLQDGKVVGHFTGKQPNGILPKELTEICPDPSDGEIFWIGTRGNGLVKWHLTKGLVKVYTIDDGLPNNTVYCMLPDKRGNIWCSTNRGIFRFQTALGKITSFAKEDGLSGNEFNRAHKFLFPDGRMAFGGLDGYTIFHPDDFEKTNRAAAVPIQITALQVDNQLHDIQNRGTLLPGPVSTLERISLPHDKNYLRIEFAAMVYNKAQNTAYRYRLSGSNKEWIVNGTNNSVAYAGLQPGNYAFEVNATDANGMWSPTVKTLAITILPPWWATWWAYLLYALVFAALARAYLFFREKSIQTRQQLAFEKKEALRLRELEGIKDRFFSNITHEFRTPLTLILTPLEKLAGDHTLSSAAAPLVATAHKSSRQLLRLVNEFLDFSKLNNGRLPVHTSTGDLALFVSDLAGTFATTAEEKGISLQLTNKGVEGLYLFDAEKWEKILYNLVSNAVKFTPPGGNIDVALRQGADDVVELAVANTGPGITAHHLPHIFDRFYQAHDAPAGISGGTGIGLALVKELAALMEGNIEVASQPGVLTTFTLQMPLAKAAASITDKPALKSTATALQADDGQLPLILIAEDNDELRHFLVETLEHRYRVVQASNGLQAWEIVMAELPDLVISDVMMPGIDGFELCARVKEDVRTAHTLFILLTSKAAHDAKLQGIHTGANDYLTKPFQMAELEGRIANLLQQQQKTRAHLKAQLLPSKPTQVLPTTEDVFLKQVYTAMDAKLGDADLNIAYLCSELAMSRSTLNRKLKALLDTSANDLIRQYRLQHSAVLLGSGMDMATIAYQVGFSSPSYFSQCFKEQFGVTPSEYAARLVHQ